MPPSRIETIYDFCLWIEEIVDRHGAELATPDVVHAEEDLSRSTGRVVSYSFPRRRNVINFPDGAYIDWDLLLTPGLEPVEYHIRYFLPSGLHVLRLDKHEGHEDAHGSDTHLHVVRDGDTDERYPSKLYEFDEAIDFLRSRDPRES